MGIRISEMEEATSFGADDYVPIVSSGTNKKALGQKIKDFIAGFFATKSGDNISDKATFRSAIDISATNTPFDKTGTGMSAENVQAGIVELSGTRALIDGSNIANPSAFRRNIEVNKFIADSFTRSVTIAGNSNISWNAYTESKKSGYGAIGIIQFQTNNQNIVPANLCLDNSSYGIFLRNISGSSQTGTFKYTVLYVKND